ncbi:hypothetical protein [Cohnella cholangitidis]|nr:hypothetical protein [Cohnella cholangitidis]
MLEQESAEARSEDDQERKAAEEPILIELLANPIGGRSQDK